MDIDSVVSGATGETGSTLIFGSTTNNDPGVATNNYCGFRLSEQNNATSNPRFVPTVRDSVPIYQPIASAVTIEAGEIVYNKLKWPDYKCSFCNASMWHEENLKRPSSMCCQRGRVQLEKLPDTPAPLDQLLDCTDDPISMNFRRLIRVYNCLFCFTYFAGKIDNSINKSRGPYTFRMSGQNYHRFGSLLPADGNRPTFAQLYFYDTENELRNKMACSYQDAGDVDQDIVRDLLKMLDTHSSVARAFRMARDWCVSNDHREVSIKLIGERTQTGRQYNKPQVPEIAALIIGDFGSSSGKRDVIIHGTTGGLRRISELHPLYMPLQYPLLFPYGEDGYHERIPYRNSVGRQTTKRSFVTMKEYYSYRIQQRMDEGTTLIRGGRLYQQFLVDAYIAIEEERLRWMRLNQQTLRADLYQNMCDAVTRGDTDAAAVGKRIVLPSSFTGGPRYYVQNFQDAMAVCRSIGNPTVFITFTANQKWDEVGEMLSEIPGQDPSHRQDVIVRLFKMKLVQLLKDIQKRKIFGETLAVIYTIEFQKRGLPHAHILVSLKKRTERIETSRDIDMLISAELPCRETDPAGFQVVTEFMLHGPCGAKNPNSPCMADGKCTKHFPKSFQGQTTINEDGFPLYRRRNTGVAVIKAGRKLDNRFVVPYNRYLLLRYRAHINVEWCNKSGSIKYLFKYVNKGPDRATTIIQENVFRAGTARGDKVIEVDEIKNYLDCRYLSPCEACWRIFGFDIHQSTPTVMRLTFHLPDQNIVTVHDTNNLSNVVQRERVKDIMFTEWFVLNQNDDEARRYTYADIPKKYVWRADLKMWQRRKQGNSVGRIIYCHPTSGERYYLRLLLNIVKGPTSFEELRTVDGQMYGTFREACCMRGIVNDDREWTAAIVEAHHFALGKQIRQLFVTILLFCEVSSPAQLWQENWKILSEDIPYQKKKQFRYHFPDLQLTEEQIQNYCLLEIEEMLNRNGKSLTDYPGIPMPDPTLLFTTENRLLLEELNYDVLELKKQHRILYSALNTEQLGIYNKVVSSVYGNIGDFFFVYGAGGTGKTFLYQTIITRLRSEKHIVLAVASSGIASLLLPHGRTAHNRFVIPIELMENSTCGIKQNTHLAQLINEAKLIIWDEAPMTHRFAYEALDRTLRDIRSSRDESNRGKLFGGITLLLGGDFRQILPVISKGTRQEIVQACINNSELWTHCKLLNLTKSMRVNESTAEGGTNITRKDYNKWVLDIGEGKVETQSREGEDEETWIKIPEQFIIESEHSPIEQITKEIFPDFALRQKDPQFLRERAILTPLNDDADEINEYMYAELNSDAKAYMSSDEICKASADSAEQESLYPPEFLNTLKFSGVLLNKWKVSFGCSMSK